MNLNANTRRGRSENTSVPHRQVLVPKGADDVSDASPKDRLKISRSASLARLLFPEQVSVRTAGVD